jgi:hypothetical protein
MTGGRVGSGRRKAPFAGLFVATGNDLASIPRASRTGSAIAPAEACQVLDFAKVLANPARDSDVKLPPADTEEVDPGSEAARS